MNIQCSCGTTLCNLTKLVDAMTCHSAVNLSISHNPVNFAACIDSAHSITADVRGCCKALAARICL